MVLHKRHIDPYMSKCHKCEKEIKPNQSYFAEDTAKSFFFPKLKFTCSKCVFGIDREDESK